MTLRPITTTAPAARRSSPRPRAATRPAGATPTRPSAAATGHSSSRHNHSLRGSFSAVSPSLFASKYAFCSILQGLQEYHHLQEHFANFLFFFSRTRLKRTPEKTKIAWPKKEHPKTKTRILIKRKTKTLKLLQDQMTSDFLAGCEIAPERSLRGARRAVCPRPRPRACASRDAHRRRGVAFSFFELFLSLSPFFCSYQAGAPSGPPRICRKA